MTLRPGLGAVRAADRQRRRHRRGRARCRQPAAAGRPASGSGSTPRASTSPAPSLLACWSRCWCSASWSSSPCSRSAATSSRTGGSGSPAPAAPATWHLTRGLFTTRETTLDDDRLAGVNLSEPLGLRLARGARLSAIVTGLDRQPAGQLHPGPAAPRAGGRAGRPRGPRHARPVDAPLVAHGPRAVRRRWTRALLPPRSRAAAVRRGRRSARPPGCWSASSPSRSRPCWPGTAPAPSATPWSRPPRRPRPAPSSAAAGSSRSTTSSAGTSAPPGSSAAPASPPWSPPRPAATRRSRCSTYPRTRRSASPTRRCRTWSPVPGVTEDVEVALGVAAGGATPR